MQEHKCYQMFLHAVLSVTVSFKHFWSSVPFCAVCELIRKCPSFNCDLRVQCEGRGPNHLAQSLEDSGSLNLSNI